MKDCVTKNVYRPETREDGSLRTADVFPVVPPKISYFSEERPGIRLLFVGKEDGRG